MAPARREVPPPSPGRPEDGKARAPSPAPRSDWLTRGRWAGPPPPICPRAGAGSWKGNIFPGKSHVAPRRPCAPAPPGSGAARPGHEPAPGGGWQGSPAERREGGPACGAEQEGCVVPRRCPVAGGLGGAWGVLSGAGGRQTRAATGARCVLLRPGARCSSGRQRLRRAPASGPAALLHPPPCPDPALLSGQGPQLQRLLRRPPSISSATRLRSRPCAGTCSLGTTNASGIFPGEHW